MRVNGIVEDVALLFKADVLRPDLANHYPPYWKERGKLLEDVKRHDTAFRKTATRVSKTLTLLSYAETGNHPPLLRKNDPLRKRDLFISYVVV
jgi:hypothetical protein